MQETHRDLMDELPTQRLRATGSMPLRLRLVNLEVVSNNRALFQNNPPLWTNSMSLSTIRRIVPLDTAFHASRYGVSSTVVRRLFWMAVNKPPVYR